MVKTESEIEVAELHHRMRFSHDKENWFFVKYNKEN
jgi:hypothetical protein